MENFNNNLEVQTQNYFKTEEYNQNINALFDTFFSKCTHSIGNGNSQAEHLFDLMLDKKHNLVTSKIILDTQSAADLFITELEDSINSLS